VSRTFAFRDDWTVDAPPERVRAVLEDLEHYPDWWPEVRAVAKLGPDDALVVCRSRLPYSLELRLHAVHRLPHLLETSISGDLEGQVRYHLAPNGVGTRLRFKQDVVVVGGFLGLAARVARRLLVWNHDRMMASCVTGLRRTLR
jgi:carbon monoxide dehydrogenase subunit G